VLFTENVGYRDRLKNEHKMYLFLHKKVYTPIAITFQLSFYILNYNRKRLVG